MTIVSVPLRGVGCFQAAGGLQQKGRSFRPLAGCGLLPYADIEMILYARFRPLSGCGLFPQQYLKYKSTEVFPSPCGVWVVSTKNDER